MSIKEKLESFLDTGIVENTTIFLEEMVENIGNIDPILRDKLIHVSFGKLMREDYLTEQQLITLFQTCLDDNHLFYKIGEVNTDSVFTRTFSVLVLAQIFCYKERVQPFLPQWLLEESFEKSISYLNMEADTRGYVEGKGWAHGIAHGADFLDEVVRHPNFPLSDADKCLDAIAECLFKGVVYLDDEDGRLITVVEALLERGIDVQILIDWVNAVFKRLANKEPEDTGYPKLFSYQMCVLNFMKSLYFRMKWKCADDALLITVEENIKTLWM